MIIGDRLRQLRETKNLSQGDIENRTGLLRCYISRVENGHTVPSIETLEKLAGALEVPLWRLFHEGERSVRPPHLRLEEDRKESRKDRKFILALSRQLAQMKQRDRSLLLHLAQNMAGQRHLKSLRKA